MADFFLGETTMNSFFFLCFLPMSVERGLFCFSYCFLFHFQIRETEKYYYYYFFRFFYISVNWTPIIRPTSVLTSLFFNIHASFCLFILSIIFFCVSSYSLDTIEKRKNLLQYCLFFCNTTVLIVQV